MADEIKVKAPISSSEYKQMDFQKLFTRVQKHMSKKCAYLIDTLEKDKHNLNATEQMENYIRNYLLDRKIIAKGLSLDETVRKLIAELTQFSILNEYLDPKRNDIEEININSWQDVKVHFSDGTIKSVQHFNSPKHCDDIIRRLLRQESHVTFDNARPIVRSHLNERIRITVIGGACVDKSSGLAASIRIVNPKNLKREDFIEKGTLSGEMLDLLIALFQNGISMCITGETGSGKTTLMSYLLSQVQYHKRLFTIEEDVREFNLIVQNEEGKTLNNVIHTVTKKSEDPSQAVDQEKLLETAMTMDPDYICVAEMKGEEALAAQEAANTGHTVITTTHARSCRMTYDRMASLCKNANDSNEALIKNAKKAFPIVVYIKKYEDNVRRIEEITECVIDEDGKSQINTLYEFSVTKKYIENGKVRIQGEFKKGNKISRYLLKLLQEGTASEAFLKELEE
ncbi:CpaF/VirB11 family protein [[Clostridium] polysaccharolyticum]|uniref:Pilus assembly protein CpaF n=1 Tax=[Clostridium] polysaccharolyticum TaxID=29364 RepID=A0A1H9Y8Y2_9FIRM|nr:CpaF/VirB11 family protein [[Clostridium] polysaccharolyticum]SES65257.1 pilus assembly protein CpaF [[Clostridium] polysaccharolyticum]